MIGLATGTGLVLSLCQIWLHERDNTKQASREEFLDWLGHHRHEQVKGLLCHNAQLCDGLDEALQQNQKELVGQLSRIESILMLLLSKTSEFQGMFSASERASVLSDQALHILRQLVDSGQGAIVSSAGHLVIHNDGPVEVSDSRFLHDDLQRLSEAGLLRRSEAEIGVVYAITREAVAYLDALDRPSTKKGDGSGSNACHP
jgi:hypothetical protein